MNNKGFAVTGMLYILLLIFITMFITILGMFAGRLNIYEKIKEEIIHPTRIQSVSFEKDEETVVIDSTLQLIPIIEPSGAKVSSLTWTSSDASVATVSEVGLVTGKKVGTATITVTTSNNKSATVTVSVVGGPTKTEPSSTETHKGIVYLDPTDLNKECNASNSVSTTNTNSGCMKWYIFDDSGSNYKMILDHNVIAVEKWNYASNTAGSYSTSQPKKSMDEALANWKIVPRFITADEVVEIVGGVSTFNVNNKMTWFYLEGTGSKKQTQPTYNNSKRSKYAWLYDNTYKCKSNSTDYGCDVEDNKEYSYYSYPTSDTKSTIHGYWTSTQSGDTSMWTVVEWGRLNYTASRAEPSCGIRPVIEISKLAIK